MKYGIDVNNELLCNRVLDKVKEKGHVIVDLTVEKWENRGQEVFKKVILGNITNIDFYLGIEFIENIDMGNLFYSDNEYAKKHSYIIEKSLNNKISKIICHEGSHLYLIKNMECPGVYIKIPLSKNLQENEMIIDIIIDALVDSK